MHLHVLAESKRALVKESDFFLRAIINKFGSKDGLSTTKTVDNNGGVFGQIPLQVRGLLIYDD